MRRKLVQTHKFFQTISTTIHPAVNEVKKIVDAQLSCMAVDIVPNLAKVQGEAQPYLIAQFRAGFTPEKLDLTTHIFCAPK